MKKEFNLQSIVPSLGFKIAHKDKLNSLIKK